MPSVPSPNPTSSSRPKAPLPGFKTLGAIHRDAATIGVHESVLEEILDYSEQDLSREIGGFLIGVVDDQTPAGVEVRYFLPALDTRSGSASLTFTHETWATLTREVEQRYPNELVLGWHHTHPGLGVFLSAYDLFIHRNFFREPWQIAMVVDPKRHEFGFFQWRADAVVDCGFVCLSEIS
jgi:proteasome lid subunit RPN8/RPN11